MNISQIHPDTSQAAPSPEQFRHIEPLHVEWEASNLKTLAAKIVRCYGHEPHVKFRFDEDGVRLHITKGELHCTINELDIDWFDIHDVTAAAVDLVLLVPWLTVADMLAFLLQHVIGATSDAANDLVIIALREGHPVVDDHLETLRGDVASWTSCDPYTFLT
jgi:hypothetical protein